MKLDKRILRHLQSLNEQHGDVDHLTYLIDNFTETAPGLIHSLEEAIRLDDLPLIERSVSQLKESASELGAIHFSKLCYKLERQVREHRFEDVKEIFSQIEIELENAISALQSEWRNRAS